MTYFRKIEPVSSPFVVGTDDNGRIEMACNFQIECEYTATLPNIIQDMLVDAGLGTFGTDIGVSPLWTVPTGDGPYILITETGGLGHDKTHNETWPPAYIQPRIQLWVVGAGYQAVAAVMNTASATLGAVRNQDITP